MAKIAVVGPGAMGCLFAVKLARAGNKVHLVDYRADRAERLNKLGITLESPEGNRSTEHVPVATAVPVGVELVIVLVKSQHTASLRFPPEVSVLTLQNGLGNVETLCNLVGSARVLAGVTTEAAHLLSEGQVRHAAAGLTQFGAWTSCPVTPAYRVLQEAGFHVEITESPGQLIWEKVAISSAINPLTALLDVPNGKLLEIPEIRQLMRDLVVEATKVAATEGYRFPHSLVERAEQICRDTRNNVSSMLQDIRAGRPTEIRAISGEILRRAQLASLPTPRTRVIYQLVRGMESR
ncbi:MAG TPA: 2-dehydropantoate 2-reductase [Candidatus Hydrogenedentes bacterium]|nr:2-dehydropantoate 2-reductase [Candidatus Hydrogenedentota bacterium]HOK89339.1 2-dehydropantoate 2-reductase [Candidatus Hydrogenedentota bacterium]HPO30120.1 2-dehydropantoate 2-reductase [Candidatus Hydrogenedentota bacterium]